MKIVSISWVRNEADVIEAFVRHTCTFVDRMIIVNNRSTDATGDILVSLKNEGLPLDLRSDNALDHPQGEALSKILHELRSDPPDFVLPLDADEFLKANDRSDIRSTIDGLPKDIATLIKWQTYIPLPTDNQNEAHVLRRIRNRKARELPEWSKVIIPKAALLKNVTMLMGSHALIDTDTRKNARHAETDLLALAHFPVRSSEQIAGKVFGGWLSQKANPNRAKGAIFQWKAIFDELKTGKEIDPETLRRFALDYGTEKQWSALPAEEKSPAFRKIIPSKNRADENATINDPLETDGILRYPAPRLPALQILAESAETLAEEVASLRRKKQQEDHGRSGGSESC